MASCLVSTYHLRNWDFLGKWGFWTDLSDSCTLKGLMGVSPLGSLPWAVIWQPGTNKNPWSLTTSSLSPSNPISKPVLSWRKWKHSGLEFPRWLYSIIKSIACFTHFLRFSWTVFNGSPRSDSTISISCQCVANVLYSWLCWILQTSRSISHCVNPLLFLKGHPDNEHRLHQLCGC